MFNSTEHLYSSQEDSLNSFEARESQEELFKNLSQVTKKRTIGALVGLSIYPKTWLKSPDIAKVVDLNRTTIGKGCNELYEAGLALKRIAPGTENQNKPTLIFKLKPDIPLQHIVGFLKTKHAYKNFVYPEILKDLSKKIYRQEEIKATEQIPETDSAISSSSKLPVINNVLNSSKKETLPRLYITDVVTLQDSSTAPTSFECKFSPLATQQSKQVLNSSKNTEDKQMNNEINSHNSVINNNEPKSYENIFFKLNQIKDLKSKIRELESEIISLGGEEAKKLLSSL